MTVVEFPGVQRHVWRCNCGGTTHYVHSDGGIECAVCGAEGPHGTWHLPEPSEEPEEGAEAISVRVFDGWDLAQRRALKDAGTAGVACIVTFHDDGRVRTTMNGMPENEDDLDWYRRRFETAMHDVGIGVAKAR